MQLFISSPRLIYKHIYFSPMIHLENINKTYHNGAPLHVLKGITLDIRKGEFVSIMGASGSGKSTLLNILGILDNYDSGDYYLNGTLIKNLSETRSAEYRNRMIGFIFQSFNLIEEMTVEELLKCTVIASANDAAVALAEHVAGSEDAFVAEMNKRAAELGMKNTKFENVTGLDDTTKEHLTSAEDIAIMSMELIKYDIITKYSSLWQDSIRDGEFTLTNTNRLVRFYEGCNGLKTGSTDKAGFCVSASAKRGNMQLIAVIMGAPTRDERNADARALLDYGFSTYALWWIKAYVQKYILNSWSLVKIGTTSAQKKLFFN